MELLLVKNKYLIKYNVVFDEEAIWDFLKEIALKYSDYKQMVLKVKNEKEILNFCDAYQDLKLEKHILPTYKKIKKGVNKGKKKMLSSEYYRYSFTAVYYPELYYKVVEMFGLNTNKRPDYLNLLILLPFITAKENNKTEKWDYYLPSCHSYKRKIIATEVYKSLYDKIKLDEYIESVIESRSEQSSCLNDLLNLLTLETVEKEEINEPINDINFGSFFSPIIGYELKKIMNTYSTLQGHPSKEINPNLKYAQKNSDIYDNIRGTKVVSLNDYRKTKQLK